MRPGSTASACLGLLRRDLLLAWRRRSDLLLPLVYALIVASLFPFALGPERELLARIGPGVVLVTVTLAMLLSLDGLFRGDAEDGSLDQLLLAPQSLAALMAMRILGHWLTSALPLILITPLLGGMLQIPTALVPVLLLSLLIATPLVSMFGAVLAALAAGARRSGMLLALMLLPLLVPVLIFAAGAVAAAREGLPWVAPLALLGAVLVLALVLAPVACAAALRIGLDA